LTPIQSSYPLPTHPSTSGTSERYVLEQAIPGSREFLREVVCAWLVFLHRYLGQNKFTPEAECSEKEADSSATRYVIEVGAARTLEDLAQRVSPYADQLYGRLSSGAANVTKAVERSFAAPEELSQQLSALAMEERGDGNPATIALVISCDPVKMSASLEYSADRLLPEVVSRAIGDLQILLSELRLNPLVPLSAINLLALPAPTSSCPELGTIYAPPRDPIEGFLADTFGELLSQDRVGINDDFVELGGDSVFVVQLISRIWERFGVDISTHAFFNHPTVAKLASLIVQLSTEADNS
jgi:acyl carrier protein